MKQPPRTASTVVALVALLALVAACGSNDGGFDVSARWGGPSETAPEPPALTIEDIAERRTAWERSAPDAYRYAITSTCGCDWGGSFTVTVVGDRVVEVEPTGAPEGDRFRRWFGQSVDAMFDMFDEAVRIGAEESTGSRVTAAFDGDRGHPVAFSVRWGADGTPYEAEITGFTALEPAEITRLEDQPAEPTVPVHISNQSFDHPDAHITLEVDGELLVDSVFPVGSQHVVVTYDLPMPPGPHELVLASDAGASLTHVVRVEAGEPLFISISHWTATEPGEEPARFSVTASDEPIGFG